MADEFGIINNPTNTPEAVSTGYQRQNTRAEAASNGIDLSVAEISGSDIKIRVSGPVDVNGVLYDCEVLTTLTPVATGFHYIYLSGSGDSLTPLLTQNDGTYVYLKNARYTASNERILNWIIYNDGSSIFLKRLFQLDDDYLDIIRTNVPAFHATGVPNQTISSTSPTKLTFDTIVFDVNSDFDLSNERYVAPLNAIYNFNFSMEATNEDNTTAVTVQFYLYKNGVLFFNFGTHPLHADATHGDEAGAYIIPSPSITMDLDAGDYIEFYIQANRVNYVVVSNKSFSGFLVSRPLMR